MMESFIRYFLLAVLYVTCLVGFTVNMIMVVANFMKWKTLRSLPACDKILSSLAISRGLSFISIFSWNSVFRFFPWIMNNSLVLSTFYIQFMFIFYSSHWLATLLCVFYCMKIVTYNYKLFIFLKTRISTMVPQLILSSLLISLISSLPFGWYGYDLKLQNLSNHSTGNMTEYEVVTVVNLNNRFLIYAVGSFLPFVIFSVANSLLIHFLLIHTRRMRSNESHIQSPNLESHFKALKSMSLFLLLQIIFLICMNLFISGTYLHIHFYILIYYVILCSPPLLHSLYMISSNSEVKKMFASVYLSLMRCF
ncbi:taste receptor type 2 member 40-like [Hyla sarda]|uniref:taste receptor type 2 member 40-like n=1 Tax=Hyla sarda TaxID=327740 RepID=UPI0024C2AC10|nr:taste receptor type 2 member 40-like [Hyla sarda]